MSKDLDPVPAGGVSNEAVVNATGKPWTHWMSLLDEAGGREMNHKQLVAVVAQHPEASAWWQQQITVTYEKSRGLREKHEVEDGYQLSRSRTLAAPAERVYDAWIDDVQRRKWLPDVEVNVRKATPHKSIRLDWNDGTLVQIYLTAKGENKTAVSVHHTKLPDGSTAEAMKSSWVESLDRLQAVVEDS